MHLTEVFSIPVDQGRYLIYAPLKRCAFIGNAAVVDCLARLRQGLELSKCVIDDTTLEFLKRLEILSTKEDRLPVTSIEGSPRPTGVTLLLTTACNLRCLYCYASSGDRAPEHMSLSTARHAIDFVVSNATQEKSEQIQLNYHGGGEPTVHWRVLTESLMYAKARAARHDVGVSSSLSTNGIISNEQVDWMISNLDGCSVSFDGHPRIQDQFRVKPNGEGSSDTVLATLRKFNTSELKYGIRMTVAANAIPALPESVEYICKNFRPQKIHIEPAYSLGRWKDRPSSETEDFVLKYLEAQQVAESHNQQIGFSGARLGVLTNHFCGVSSDSFAVSAAGNITSCLEAYSEDVPYADKFFYGKPDPSGCGYTFDMNRLTYLRQLTVENRDYCQDCFAKWTCAGDCYYKILSHSGDVEFCGSDRCHIIRELTKHQILKRIHDAGGLFWHELPPDKKDMIHMNKSIHQDHKST